MKWTFTTTLTLWMVAEVLGGEEHSCTASKTKDCIREINCGFTSDTKTVKVRHMTLSGKEEVVAVCDWMAGAFDCIVARGYRVNITSPTTFHVSIDSDVTCPNGNFTFTDNGSEHVTCFVDFSKDEGEASESEEQVETGCQENTEAAPGNKNRVKRSPGSNCPHNPANKDTSGNSLIVPVVVPTVVCALVSITVIGTVVYLRRRNRRRKEQREKTRDVALPLTQDESKRRDDKAYLEVVVT